VKNSKPACGKKKEKVIEIDLIERNFAELDEKRFHNGKRIKRQSLQNNHGEVIHKDVFMK